METFGLAFEIETVSLLREGRNTNYTSSEELLQGWVTSLSQDLEGEDLGGGPQ
jgi:hypothetical protein